MATDLVSKVAVLAAGAAAAVYIDKKTYLSHDIYNLWGHGMALLQAQYLAARNTRVADIWEELVDSMPSKVLVTFEGRKMTAAQLEEQSNRVAHWAVDIGLTPGSIVALIMENRPEFITTWIGLSKVGVVAALINTHVVHSALLHSLHVSQAPVVIFGSECTAAVEAIAPQLGASARFFSYLDGNATPGRATAAVPSFALSLDAHLACTPLHRPDVSSRQSISSSDAALLIFTSGTTGLPKAARVEHQSILARSLVFVCNAHVTSFDRLYCALPLYHTAGGVLAVGMMLLGGCSIALARKFSTSTFWHDVRLSDCTLIQYIGEMCRYLLRAPPSDMDRVNLVRMAIGNGLRPDIWAAFQDRFGIPAVAEFYGATEGVAGMLNMCRTPADRGHLGQYGYLTTALAGYVIAAYDVEHDVLQRDTNGHLIACGPNQVGELVIPIRSSMAIQKFQGYFNNPTASEAKTIANAFSPGDLYFRTGDLFRRDAARRMHFVDRVGDTFRWKGENVATTQVAEMLATFPGLSDVCVYGVAVPDHDGRACMVAMVFDESTVDLDAFAAFCAARLPPYAVPRFVRQLQTPHVTGTLKQETAKLRGQGIDLALVDGDRLFFWNASTYSRLTAENIHVVLASSRL
ncbi:Aste57867_18176 [Aphanomyces stellatus]|uniref:Aste57867_18176 protein n=1 Tax=Aphanomyces stellatus TaxID=120398 RepID=A0A485LD48_9STRA|nr:hypothetical protein As57867_018114 [Aphanomyces stellatus]VFT94914.1 Aste57867_18176 [Aphanomyces stellatus]